MQFEKRSGEIVNLIQANAADIVLGSGVDQKWVDNAESVLGVTLPPSYKWFLKKYGGGYIFSEILYGIIPEYIEDGEIADDIRSQYFISKKNGNFKTGEILISDMEEGNSTFFFRVENSTLDSEYRVFKRNFFSGNDEVFSSDFFDFLEKIILEKLSRK